MRSPPQILLTRLLLPLGIPLLTIGFTGAHPQQLNRVARHLFFFGSVGVAMGISIEKGSDEKSEEISKNERRELANQLRLLIAAGGVADEAKSGLSQAIEDMENRRYFR